MDTLPIPTPITSIQIFPAEFENDEYVFFHGTSRLYSTHIEKYGLIPNHKPLGNYCYRIHDIAEHIFSFTCNNPVFSEFNNAVKESTNYLKVITRISFSAVSLCAAKYALGDTVGGQGLRHLRRLVNLISTLDFNLIDEAIINISDSQRHHFNEAQKMITTLSNSDGVVYAFRFEPKDIISLHYDNHVGHSVLLTIDHVAPEQIVAKMLVPQTTIFPPDLIKAANKKTIDLGIHAYSTEFIRRINVSNSERHDINILNGTV